MNKVLLLFLCFPFFGYAQITSIPDANFELALVNLGYDNFVDGYVLTSNINSIDSLIVSGCFIESLEGIAAFH